MPTIQELVEDLKARRARIEAGCSGKQPPPKQKARDRIKQFFDPGTFVEIDCFARHLGREFGMAERDLPADGIIIGHGKVNGRPVALFSEDYTCMAGTFGEMHGRKMCKILDFGAQNGMPVVGFNDSGGARLQENLGPLSVYGQLFYRNSVYSGVIPQIAVMLGPVAGGQAYSPGLNDFIIMTKGISYTFIAGPPLVEAVIGEKITVEELGGPEMHSTVSGVCHVLAEDEADAIQKTKDLLSYLPSSNREKPPWKDTGDPPSRRCEKIYEIFPADREKPYDMKKIIEQIVDNGQFFEVHHNFARNMITCFARIGGHSVGIYANNPRYLGGSIDVNAAEKAARFVRFCDAFNIPIISLVDTPAYLIGSRMEKEGIIYNGAKLLFAISEATVPQITVYMGKAYAGGYLAMGSKDFKVDFVFAWPTAAIALVGPRGTINVVYYKQLKQEQDPVKREELRKKLEEEFIKTYMSVYYPAGFQHIDDIIDPADTRVHVCRALEALQNKKMELPWRKHGNIPL